MSDDDDDKSNTIIINNASVTVFISDCAVAVAGPRAWNKDGKTEIHPDLLCFKRHLNI